MTPQRLMAASRMWHGLPPRGRLLLVLAIFFTFGTIGVVQDVMTAARMRPWVAVAAQVLFSGLLATGYAYAAMRRWTLFPLVFVFQFAGAWLLARAMPGFWAGGAVTAIPAALRTRLVIDGLLIAALIVIGYVLFIVFINREGSRHLKLRAEVDLAAALQARLVPRVAAQTDRYEVLGFSEPSTEVGGDLVDHLELDGDGYAYVADVAGHGIPAGTLMGMVKAALHMRLDGARDLGEALAALDRVLTPLKEPERFVTLAGLRVDAGGVVESASAGHPPILHITRDGRSRRIENQHLPLGIEGGHGYGAEPVACGSGDLFVLYSDGLIEVTDGGGRQLGIDALEAIARRHAADPLERIAAALMAAVRAHGPRDDDQTLLLLRLR